MYVCVTCIGSLIYMWMIVYERENKFNFCKLGNFERLKYAFRCFKNYTVSSIFLLYLKWLTNCLLDTYICVSLACKSYLQIIFILKNRHKHVHICTFWFLKNQYFCNGHKPKLIISPRHCENDMTSSKPFNRYGSKLLIILYNKKKLMIKCISSNFLWNG